MARRGRSHSSLSFLDLNDNNLLSVRRTILSDEGESAIETSVRGNSVSRHTHQYVQHRTPLGTLLRLDPSGNIGLTLHVDHTVSERHRMEQPVANTMFIGASKSILNYLLFELDPSVEYRILSLYF